MVAASRRSLSTCARSPGRTRCWPTRPGFRRGSALPELAASLTTIRDAMLANPDVVAGRHDRLDTSLMKAAPGRLVSKAGMEALRAISILPGALIIVGAGIAGVTVAERLSAALTPQLADGAITVELLDDGAQPGGKLRTTPFAGRPAVDEGADAFLTRFPTPATSPPVWGWTDRSTSPATGAAFVWHGRLHPIPDGLALGLPGRVLPLVTSRLLSVRGIARAAVEPLLPRRPDGDSVGRLVRSRFGTEVHERLVDPLVGSIYATDTDRFSLAMVPQLATLARRRSLLLAARAARSRAAATGPVFAAPVAGMQQLATAAAERAVAAGATVVSGRTVHVVAADGPRWRVDDEPADVVVLATPAATDRSAHRGGRRRPRRPPRRDGPRRRRHRHPRRRRRVAGRLAWRTAATSCPSPTRGW